MSIPFTGGCACGAIRYECSAEPLMALNCHCRDCQRMTGSAFGSFLGVATPPFRFTKGQPKYYPMQADSGQTKHYGFCPDCGALVCEKMTERPDMVIVAAGSLDDTSWHQPQMDLFTSRAHSWDFMNPDLPKFPAMPPVDE